MQGLAVKMLQARTLVISQGVTSELTQRILTTGTFGARRPRGPHNNIHQFSWW